MRFILNLLFLVVFSHLSFGQPIGGLLSKAEKEKSSLLAKLNILEEEIISLKQKEIIQNLKKLGLPSANYVEHHALILEYSEEHEQAKWVAHMILPEIKNGLAFRSNDFRPDPKITTGTAIQQDFFLTDTLANGNVEYDGFGYDRGHLAPSADFRWSALALSESYFYSNMSPQLPDFNRKKWAELEDHLRRYVILNDVPLYIVTLPILEEGLPKIERAVNHVSIPSRYAKAVYDPINKIAIGFIMDHKFLDHPLESYAVSIDELEKVAGLDVFATLPEILEAKLTKEDWFKNLELGDREPLDATQLPRAHFNTIQADMKIGERVTVCGHIVASRYSKKGHLWLNFDRRFPNQVFSVFTRKEDLGNFSYDLKNRYTNQCVCVKGKVEDFSDTPSITLKNEKNIFSYNPEKMAN